MKIILIDNYDSFTFNLYHYLSSFSKVDVFRNDKVDHHFILKKKYNKIVISPGPGNPNQSGNCLKIVKNLYKKMPILGVCLGHQIIGQIFGSKIIQAKELVQGKTSNIINKKIGILYNLPKSFSATIYHRLVIDRKSLEIRGWSTKDAYSNNVSFIINNLEINKDIIDDFFKIPQEKDL